MPPYVCPWWCPASPAHSSLLRRQSAVLSGKESALAVRSRDEELTSSKETWVNWAEGRRPKAVLLQFLGLVPAVLS